MPNKIMKINLDDPDDTQTSSIEKILVANADTELVRLNDIYEMGNSVRRARGLRKKKMQDFIHSKETVEFLIALEDLESKERNFRQLEFDNKGRVLDVESLQLKYFEVKKGKYGGTWVHPLVAIEALGKLDARVRAIAYRELYNNNILGKRIRSAENYKRMMKVMHDNLEHVPTYSHKHIADAIRLQIGIPKPKGTPAGEVWNNATAEQLEQRDKLELATIALFDTGMVATVPDMLQMIKKMKV